MKGIILAGGTGSRLYPATKAICKQLLPIYDKPMIYYPLSILMLSNIKDILMIVRPQDESLFKLLLRDGSQWGINIEYKLQENPNGLPEAFILGESFIDGDQTMLILGDNFIYGQNLQFQLQNAVKQKTGGTIFTYLVKDPERYGVLVLDDQQKPIDVVEKPKNYISNLAIPGLYIFDERVCEVAKALKPSKRGETEITDVIRWYMERGELKVSQFGRGTAWFDSGTSNSLLQASSFVHTIQTRQGLSIACLEEVALHMGYIDSVDIDDKIQSDYAIYSRNI
jgi:glucose-1-phosphate thymidylyltransferase